MNTNRINIDQLYVTCFIISLFTAQRVSNVSTSIFRSLWLIVDLFYVLYCSGSMFVGVTVWFGWGGVVSLCRLKHCFSLHKDTTPSRAAFAMSPGGRRSVWPSHPHFLCRIFISIVNSCGELSQRFGRWNLSHHQAGSVGVFEKN